ncbi:hypothetical protein Kpol_1070p37, partial [Vanderwaltozyma polyspora DSM 70294]
MSVLSKVFVVVAIIQLMHSGFSSSEFHRLVRSQSINSSRYVGVTLPLDIKLEAYIGMILFTIGIFMSFEK